MTNLLANALGFMCSPNNLGEENAAAAAMKIESLTQVWGPVVETYPSWHPLVAAGNEHPLSPAMTPQANCGYEGVDHSIYFRNAFLTCPYGGGKKVIASVERIKFPDHVRVEAEILDIPIYHPDATPVLVTCSWTPMPEEDGTINRRYAFGTMLEMELALWREANAAETWETMRPYFLGLPYCNESSFFVNQDTGQVMKRVWNDIIEAGVFGGIKS
jgi:hypothetical protein